MFEDGLDLFTPYTGKPLEELIDARTGFQIFE